MLAVTLNLKKMYICCSQQAWRQKYVEFPEIFSMTQSVPELQLNQSVYTLCSIIQQLYLYRTAFPTSQSFEFDSVKT